MDPKPRVTSPTPPHPSEDDVFDLSHKEPYMVNKTSVMEYLRKEMTEERTDRVLHLLSEEAKKSLPDLPVEVAERVLDFLVPEKLLDALDRVL